MAVTRARLAIAMDRALASAGDAVMAALLVAREATSDDPLAAGPYDAVTGRVAPPAGSRHPVRLVMVDPPPSDTVPTLGGIPPRDRHALVAPGGSPVPRPGDAIELDGHGWRVVDAADKAAGLGLLVKVILRDEGPLAAAAPPSEPTAEPDP